MMYHQLRSYKSEELKSLTERMRLFVCLVPAFHVATSTGYD